MSGNEMTRVNRNKGKEPPKKPKKKKRLTKKRVLWTLFFTVAVAVFCALGGYLFIMINGEKLLQANQDKLTINPPTKIYDRNANLIAELSLEKSEPVEYDELPKQLVDAFIATEDRRFWEHSGVDLWSIGRAAVKDVMARSLVEGGSTITQQLAKNIFLTRDKTFFRKATEMSIAMALERQKSKEEIITMYLNRINFGGTTYGIKAASIRYFGQSDLKQLKLWQIATLAGMPQAPSRYNPLRNPNNSKERRGVVLSVMHEQGLITEQEMNEAKAVDYNYKPPEKKQRYQAFIDYAIDEAEEKYGLTEDDLNIGGYNIYTTMDADAQSAVEDAFADADNFEKSVDDKPVQGSMVIMNQENGSIVAMLGGRNYEKKGYSRIRDSRRSPGSSIKPLVAYAPALESGKFSMDSRISNQKQCFGKYCPNNLHGYSSTIDMASALTKSENIPAVWLLNEIGVNTGVEFARKLGLSIPDEDKNLSIALGGMSKGTNTFEMAQAFSAFANGGTLNQAYVIKSIEDSSGEVRFKANPDPKRVMKESTAYQMTQMMQNVVQSGTGKKARIDRPVAGKTGTTQSGFKGVSSNRDVWFVGYTPELTAAVWMGYDDPDREHLLKHSSPLAAAFWGKVMEQALKNFPAKSFPEPDKEEMPAPPSEEPLVVEGVSGLSGSYDPATMTVSLSWNDAPTPGAQYRVYRKETSENAFTRILDTQETAAEDISAMPGLTYDYYVTAYYPEEDAESGPSNMVSILIEDAEPSPEPSPSPSPTVSEPSPTPTMDGGFGEETPGNGGEDGWEELPSPDNGGGGSNSGSGMEGNNGNGNGNGSGNGNGNGNAGNEPGNGNNGRGNGPGNGNGQGQGSGGGTVSTPDQVPADSAPSPVPPDAPVSGQSDPALNAPQDVNGTVEGTVQSP